MIGRKPCRFVVDTGATISIIKRGISRKKVYNSDVIAKSVTGDLLKIYGRQEVTVTLSRERSFTH